MGRLLLFTFGALAIGQLVVILSGLGSTSTEVVVQCHPTVSQQVVQNVNEMGRATMEKKAEAEAEDEADEAEPAAAAAEAATVEPSVIDPCSKSLSTDEKIWIAVAAWNNTVLLHRALQSVQEQSDTAGYDKIKVVVFEDYGGVIFTEEDKAAYRHLDKVDVIFLREEDDMENNAVKGGSAFAKYKLFAYIGENALPHEYVILLDGDDTFADRTSLQYIHGELQYHKPWFAWGRHNGKHSDQCNSVSERQFEDIRHGIWSFCHPRMFQSHLIKHLEDKDFVRLDGTWLQKATDRGFIYKFLEMAGPNRSHYLGSARPLYNYSFLPSNGLKVFSPQIIKGDKEYTINMKPATLGEENIHVVACVFDRNNTSNFLKALLQSRAPKDIVPHAVKFHFHICNNNHGRQDELEVLAKSILSSKNNNVEEEHTLEIHKMGYNMGGLSRFILAQHLMSETFVDYVIMLDDDQYVLETTLAEIYLEREPRTYKTWYGKNWKMKNGTIIKDYWSSTEFITSNPELRYKKKTYVKTWQYGGTGMSIIDASIFRIKELFQIEHRYMFVEDMWLSYIVQLLGWRIERLFVRFMDDGRAYIKGTGQFKKLTDVKQELLRKLGYLDCAHLQKERQLVKSPVIDPYSNSSSADAPHQPQETPTLHKTAREEPNDEKVTEQPEQQQHQQQHLYHAQEAVEKTIHMSVTHPEQKKKPILDAAVSGELQQLIVEQPEQQQLQKQQQQDPAMQEEAEQLARKGERPTQQEDSRQQETVSVKPEQQEESVQNKAAEASEQEQLEPKHEPGQETLELKREETTHEPVILDYRQFDFRDTIPTAPSCLGDIISSSNSETNASSFLLDDDDIDFTLVLQLTRDRIWLMEEHCRRWGSGHPMSIAIAVNHKGHVHSFEKYLQRLGCDTGNMTITVHRHILSDGSYPVNRLRNAALAGVKTSHLVMLDIDLLPSPNLYENLRSYRRQLREDHQTALVIPAFTLRKQCKPLKDKKCRRRLLDMVPNNKSDVIESFPSYPERIPTERDKDATIGIIHGHESTRYHDWCSRQREDELLPIDCLTDDRYEPYLVVRYCQQLPPFQEAFTGYKNNKITWIRQLVRTGYTFHQLGGGFLVHFPHDQSKSFQSWERERQKMTTAAMRHQYEAEKGWNPAGSVLPDSANMRKNQIADSFGRWMEENVPDRTRLGSCNSSNVSRGGSNWDFP